MLHQTNGYVRYRKKGIGALDAIMSTCDGDQVTELGVDGRQLVVV